jgi:hypothetical protein
LSYQRYDNQKTAATISNYRPIPSSGISTSGVEAVGRLSSFKESSFNDGAISAPGTPFSNPSARLSDVYTARSRILGELMELSIDPKMRLEAEGSIEPKNPESLGSLIVGTGQIKSASNLKISGCEMRLAMLVLLP